LRSLRLLARPVGATETLRVDTPALALLRRLHAVNEVRIELEDDPALAPRELHARRRLEPRAIPLDLALRELPRVRDALADLAREEDDREDDEGEDELLRNAKREEGRRLRAHRTHHRTKFATEDTESTEGNREKTPFLALSRLCALGDLCGKTFFDA